MLEAGTGTSIKGPLDSYLNVGLLCAYGQLSELEQYRYLGVDGCAAVLIFPDPLRQSYCVLFICVETILSPGSRPHIAMVL